MMALEPRMMYDAAAAATVGALAHHHHHDGAGDHANIAAAEQSGQLGHRSNSGQGDSPAAGLTFHHHAPQNVQTPTAAEQVKATSLDITAASAPTGSNPAQELVFIDSHVTDYQVLLNGVKSGVTAVLLDPSRDGLVQIADYLSAHPDAHPATIDIVAHGAQGELLLGATTLTDANLAADAAALQRIGEALAPGGAIALYGCNVAGGAAGLTFVADLSKDAGGADVAAATHEVGAAAQGGSWNLDASTGRALVDTPFTAATLQAFPDLLTAAPTVTADTAPTSYAGGGAAVPIDPGLIVTDPSGILVGASVQIVGFFNGDTLTINGATSGTINNGANGTISYAFSGSVLTLGGADTVADYQAALRLVSYSFAGNSDPTGGGANTSRSIYWVVNNGTLTNEILPTPQPIDNDQPSLGLNQLVVAAGVYPDRGGTNTGNGMPLGSILTFVGNYAPGGTMMAAGQALKISQDTALFSLLGTNYGGDGTSTFWLPNLQGRLATGYENNNPNANLGESYGSDTITLQLQNAPHRWGGFDTPFNNDQPSQTINYIINTGGSFPGSGTGNDEIGEVVPFLGNFAPSGFMFANGQLLSIRGNETLFSVIGTTYGGDGTSTFALPDLTGRTITGAGTDFSRSVAAGTVTGQDSTALTVGNLPPLQGSGLPVSNDQPSLALTYLVATAGIFPSSGGGGSDLNFPYLGEVIAFAGTGSALNAMLDHGWAVASGEVLGISQNQALFQVIGTAFGGNGTTTFALPDLVGRSVAGLGTNSDGTTVTLGEQFGSDSFTITSAQSPLPVVSTSTLLISHTAPTVSAGATATFASGGAAVTLDGALTVNDVDSGGNLTGATISIGAGFVGGSDSLHFTNQNGITGSYDAASGVLTLSGTDSIAHYQAALEQITFSTTATTAGTRTIDWTVTDGVSSSTQATSTVNEVVGPTVIAGGAASFAGGGPAVTLDSAVLPLDAGTSLVGATVTINGALSGDVLSFNNGSNVETFSDGGVINASFGSGALSLTGHASLGDYQSALEQVQYSFSPSDGDPTGGGTHTARSIGWSINDGSSVSPTATSTLSVIHTPPVLTVSGSASYVERTPGSAIEPTLTVTDADSADVLVGATVTIASGLQAGDTLHFTGQNGITGSYDAATGVLTLSGSASVEAYQAALRSVSFDNLTNHNPTDAGLYPARTINWQVDDGTAVSGALMGAATNIAVGQSPDAIAAGDFNGDGVLDLAIANQASNTVSVLLGNGHGGFGPAVAYAVGSSPSSIAALDLNGDGKLDLVVTNTDSNTVSALLGNGSGGFAAATNFAVGSQPVSVAAGDLNGDGRVDLVVADRASNDVSVLLGDGSGGFAPAMRVAAGSGPVSVGLGDFNGDGRLDIAVADKISGDVRVMLGDGSGGFGAASVLAVGAFPNSLAIGDLNGDGRLDLVTANGNSVSVLLGDGNGGFAAADTFVAGAGPTGVVIADLNGDGRPDLAVTDGGSGSVSLLLGDGNGGFVATNNLSTGSGPVSPAIGDFNGDGEPDLATADLGGVSILLGSGTGLSTVERTTIAVTAVNDPAVISGTTTGVVVEAGGVNNSIPGTPTTSGILTDTDPDNPANSFQAVQAGTASDHAYGSYAMTADGTWTYAVDNGNAAVQALNAGQSLTDTFTVHTVDGTAQQITITIDGANDAAVISGITTGIVVEAGGVNNSIPGTPTAGGILTDTDPDNPANSFQAVQAGTASDHAYGSYAMTAAGTWTYAVDNSNAAVQALNAGQSLTDTFTVHTVDGTAQQITVTIDGANDAAVISGITTGTAVEAGGVNNSIPGTPTAGGVLTDTDPDNPANSFQAVQAGTASDRAYGSYAMTATGFWTYTVDNNNAAVQALNAGQSLTDTFTVRTVDGTAQQITVTIDGANDAAVIAGTTTGTVVEAGGVDNGTLNTPTASGRLTDTDVDNPANTFQAVAAGTASDHGYGSYVMTVDGTWTYSVDNNNAAVQALNVGQSLTDTFTVHTVDGTARQITVTLDGANDAPVVTAGNSTNFDTNVSQSVTVYPAISIHDVDNSIMSGAGVAIATGFVSGDTLGANTAGTSIHASYDAAHGVLTLSGNDTVQDYQKVLASVTFGSIGRQDSQVTIGWQVTDQNNLASATATSQLHVTDVIAPPHPSSDTASAIPLRNSAPLMPVVDSGPKDPLLPEAGDDGFGTRYGFSIVHADPVLTTASDATVEIKLALASLEAPLGGDVAYVVARQANGDPLPDWLTFDPATGTFAGQPPDGAIASLQPDQSSDNNIVTGALSPKSDLGLVSRPSAARNTITVEVSARDSRGNIAVTVFTIDLRAHTAGKQGWNVQQPPFEERHAALPMMSPELAAIEAAVHKATLEPWRGMPAGHGEAVSVGIGETTSAGRASLTEQLASVGWRSMDAQRNALLASLQRSR
jgi:VCBS repeat-containing protein